MATNIGKLKECVVDARVCLTQIETRLEQTSTTLDLRKVKTSFIKWLVGTAAGLSVAASIAMIFALHNATPMAPSAAQVVIIIQVPSPPQ